MPATDILDLYRYEDAIETAVKTLLTANSITCATQREAATLGTPRADVQFSCGSGMEHFHGFPVGHSLENQDRNDVLNGTLRVQLITNRIKDAADPVHSTIRAKVRNLVAGFLDTINPLLAYHAVMRVLESGTNPTITTEDNQDVSTLNFTVDFRIRLDAWPVS